MNRLQGFVIALCALAVPVWGQEQPPVNAGHRDVPVYEVTVKQGTIAAVNYGDNRGPTKIDFRGTVLLPKAKGEAKVEPKTGAVQIDAKFENITAPTRFGRQYLTYVLWAITPDGRPANLGEVLPDSSDKAKLKVTTPMRAFGLIVTAEPYFAVTQPSNIVVLENVLRPDTAGRREEVQPKYALLPRGQYPVESREVQMQPPVANGAREVPVEQYDAVVALYQAQNALQIAKAQGAQRYAPDTLERAQRLYDQAEKKMQGDKNDRKQVVPIAHEAAQAAEDARMIAVRSQARTEPQAQETPQAPQAPPIASRR